MKKILLVVLIMFLVGCGKKETTTIDGDVFVPMKGKQTFQYDDLMYIWIDPETKCHYIAGRNTKGITPRMKSDGTPMCGGN